MTFSSPGFANELHPRTALSDGVLEIPYGRYPHQLGLQILDRAAAEAMRSHFGGLLSRLARRFRGLPIYVGHPDMDDTPETLRDPQLDDHDDSAENGSNQNAGPDRRAYGWVRGVEPTETGLRLRVKWTPDGARLVREEQFGYFSPHWGMTPADDEAANGSTTSADPSQSTAYRPVELYSLGLTNSPNIPGLSLRADNDARPARPDSPSPSPSKTPSTPDTSEFSQPMITLIKDLLRALGHEVPDDADNAALETLLESALQTLKNEPEGQAAANSAATRAELQRLQTQLAEERRRRRDDELNAAINEGRISRAARAQWEKNLETDFDGNRKLLRALKPAWNSGGNPLGPTPRAALASPERAGRVAAITEAVTRKQQQDGFADYDTAFRAIRREQPELFEQE